MGFTKLFGTIVTSSIWVQPDDILRTWIALLAVADKYDVAPVSLPGLASLCRTSEERMREIIVVLESPDPDSRSLEDDGRRIRKVDGGYFIINREKYRLSKNEDDKREYMREYMRKYRDLKKNDPKDSVNNVNHVNNCKQKLAHIDVDVDKDILPSGSSDPVNSVNTLQKDKEKNPNVKNYIDHFASRFQQITGQKYLVIGSRDGNLVKRLLSTFSIEELINKTEAFFKSDDPFIKKAGLSINILFNQINKLANKKETSRWGSTYRK
jgi:hypothetical protein